jgi:hypothetical protein
MCYAIDELLFVLLLERKAEEQVKTGLFHLKVKEPFPTPSASSWEEAPEEQSTRAT